MRGKFLVRWIGVGAIGTLLGLGAGGFVGLMGLAAESISAAITAGLVFGAAIGVSIGLAQGMILSSRLENVSASRWASFTALGAAAAWAVVAYPIGRLAEVGSDPSWTTRLLGAVAVGFVAGGIVGLVQWFELERALPGSKSTILIQAAAWVPGALILAVVDGVIRTDLGEPGAVAVAAAALVAAGAVVALVQGLALDRRLPEPVSPPSTRAPAPPRR